MAQITKQNKQNHSSGNGQVQVWKMDNEKAANVQKKDTVNPSEKIKGVTTHSNSSCGWLASTTGFHYPK